MDYTDPDQPADSSPWSSSPRASRTAFRAHSNSDLQSPPSEVPNMPLENPASPEVEHNGFGSGGFSNSEGTQAGRNRSYTNETEDDDKPLAAAVAASRAGAGAQAGYGAQAQYEQQEQGASQPQRQYSRARSSQQQQQRVSIPQYKLQAKITGLERTGRKDLILRFDVHVFQLNPSCQSMLISNPTRPTSPSSAQPNSEMCAAPTPSSSSSPNT